MITIEQCRAARGLLDWTQQDLADRAGLSKTAINNFEKGYSDIKGESLRAIRTAFEQADIEFIDESGIKRRGDSAKIFGGATAFQDLMLDLAKSIGNVRELLISHLDRKFAENYGQVKLSELLDHCISNNVPVRILTTMETLPGETNARKMPPESAESGVMTVLYAQKAAFILWGHSVIVLVESNEAAAAERAHFEYLWDRAAPKSSSQTPQQSPQHPQAQKKTAQTSA